MIPGIGEDIANKIRNESRQRFLQASSSFAEATLRAATGAGVTMDEAKQKAKELTPQIGDSDEVIKQKIAAQEMYLEALKVRAGRALPASVQQIRNQPPAPVGRAAPGLPPEEQAELDRLRAKYRRNP